MTKKNIDIRPLANDTKPLADLIKLAWPKEHANHMIYSKEYLSYVLDDPQIIPELCVGAYIEDKLISFVLSKKKTINYKNSNIDVLFNTLATTHPDYSHLFPYLKLKNYCHSLACKQEFELTSGYVIDGIQNNLIETIFARKQGLKSFVAAKYGTLYKNLRVTEPEKKSTTDRVSIKDFADKDLAKCKSIIENQIKQCNFHEVMSSNELLYRLKESDFNQTKIIQDNNDLGLINLQVVNFSNNNGKIKSAVINGFFVDHLAEESVNQAMQQLSLDLHNQEVNNILIPDTGYFNSHLPRVLGFRHLPFNSTKTNLYFTLISDLAIDEKLHQFFMEVV